MPQPKPAPTKTSATTKLRAVQCSDGRVGWPDVVEYEITEGSGKGLRIPVPPTFESHPHPDPDALYNEGKACFRASVAYRTIVHDQVAYDSLKLGGYIYGEHHCGERPVVVDKRATG